MIKEIDIIALVKKGLEQKKNFVISACIGAVLGVIIALATPKTYTSEVLLVPEISSGGLGLSENLASMASSFGIDLGSSGNGMDAFYPEIYPEVLASDDFIRSLFDANVRLKNDDTPRTYYKHLTQEQKVPFWQYPLIWISELLAKNESVGNGQGFEDPFKVSKIDAGICNMIAKNISCLVDKKTSVILISVTDQDPLVAAIIVDTLQNRLQNYITTYRTKKASNDYKYYSELYENAQKENEKAQKLYAEFTDTHRDITLEKYRIKQDELENKLQFSITVMNQMATQMQASKAKIQERTPAYTLIKSAKMPHKASSMSRAMIVIMTMLFSVMAYACWLFFLKDIIKKIKE